jgi:hypothetical protein
MKKETKIPVTMRALVQRVNRKIAHDDKKLHSTRKTNPIYYVIRTWHNSVVDSIVDAADLEERARELGVLAEWEQLQS